MDLIDKQLLNIIQKDFPINQKPFEIVANKLGISETEVIERIKSLKAEGIIRRIGGSFNSKKLNYTSALCGAKVPQNRLDKAIEVINSFGEVTHNYLRDHEYNVWFTLIAESQERIDAILEEIKKQIDQIEIMNLPAINLFKINVNFNLNGE